MLATCCLLPTFWVFPYQEEKGNMLSTAADSAIIVANISLFPPLPGRLSIEQWLHVSVRICLPKPGYSCKCVSHLAAVCRHRIPSVTWTAAEFTSKSSSQESTEMTWWIEECLTVMMKNWFKSTCQQFLLKNYSWILIREMTVREKSCSRFLQLRVDACPHTDMHEHTPLVTFDFLL